jgi:ElaB/YqjD/DUF883 family membrane-anchored ribosome-binding protein
LNLGGENFMSKKRKSKEATPTIEDLNKKISDVKKLADDSKVVLEDKMKSKPLESAAMIFVVGLILGILLGSRRG